jgi:predicted secreted hydrolase
VTRKRIDRLQGRRRALSWIACAFAAPCIGADRVTSHPSPVTPYAPVLPGRPLRFPEDEGSHPAFRTEWWYITGWLEPRERAPVGFQVTFFRTRPQVDERNPSLFAARQIIIAHAALSDARRGRLTHDQKLARAAFGLAGATEKKMHVWVDDWSLAREDRSSYRVRIPAREFAMDLRFSARQPPLVQGDAGYSRKGPRPESASYYYSIPQLQVEGTLIEA